jgi:putative ABC transport system permease protein
MSSFLQDVRYALRQLRTRPTFSVVTILTLALGIGGITAIFSVVQNVLLRPPAVADPDRIIVVRNVWKGRVTYGGLSAGAFTDLQAQLKAAETLAATQTVSLTLESQDTPERIVGEKVTGDYFRLSGVAPLLGRAFSESEDLPGKDAVVVLSEQMWRARFQGDARILGRTIRLDGRPHEVIGVMPARFELADEEHRFWVPMAFTAERRTNYDEQPYTVFAKLGAGVTLAQARAELQAFAKSEAQKLPREAGRRSFSPQPFVDALLAEARPPLYMLQAAAVFVLLIACVNVGTMQLARTRSRRRELAIRNALGASAARLGRQLLTESLVLSSIGGVLGLVFASVVVRWVVLRAPATIPRLSSASVDGWALCFTFFVVLVAAALAGGSAAARVRYFQPQADMGAGRTGNASLRDRLRGAMVVAEVALALILVVGAGLLIRSGINANQVPLGFDADGLLAARVNLPAERYNNPESLKTVFRRIEEAAEGLPAVQSAALIDRAPLSGGGSNGLIPEGKPYTGEYVVQSALHIVSPQYFTTVRTPILRGRNFDANDRNGSAKVMIVNQALAQAAFGTENAIDKRLSWTQGEWITIVGVVENVHHYGVTQDAPPEFYIPLEQAPDVAIGWMANTAEIMIRTSGASATVASDLRSLMKQIDPAAPVYRVQSMEERVSETLEERRFTTLLLVSFAGLALFLASVGIYGVLSYAVTERTHEIGIRMALGAQRYQVLRMVIADGLRMVVFGASVGVVGAMFAAHLIRSLLFAVPPDDLATFTIAAVVLVTLALFACYLPAARALKIDPVIALRYD